MAAVVDTAFSFPVIIFTVASIFLLGFWILSTVIGSGLAEFELDFDADLDTDAEIDVDGNASGLLRSAFELLGITGMPLLLALNLLAILSWLVAMVAMTILGDGVAAILKIAVAVGSLFTGGFLTGQFGDRLDGLFVPHDAIRHRDLVGRRCTVTTERVSEHFGQAEARDDEGGSLIIQIRASEPNELRSGQTVLIVDADVEESVEHENAIFHVTALDKELE